MIELILEISSEIYSIKCNMKICQGTKKFIPDCYYVIRWPIIPKRISTPSRALRKHSLR